MEVPNVKKKARRRFSSPLLSRCCCYCFTAAGANGLRWPNFPFGSLLIPKLNLRSLLLVAKPLGYCVRTSALEMLPQVTRHLTTFMIIALHCLLKDQPMPNSKKKFWEKLLNFTHFFLLIVGGPGRLTLTKNQNIFRKCTATFRWRIRF